MTNAARISRKMDFQSNNVGFTAAQRFSQTVGQAGDRLHPTSKSAYSFQKKVYDRYPAASCTALYFSR